MDVGCDHHMLSICEDSSFIRLGLCNLRPITTTYADPSSLQTCITVNPLHELSIHKLSSYAYTAQNGTIWKILTNEVSAPLRLPRNNSALQDGASKSSIFEEKILYSLCVGTRISFPHPSSSDVCLLEFFDVSIQGTHPTTIR